MVHTKYCNYHFFVLMYIPRLRDEGPLKGLRCGVMAKNGAPSGGAREALVGLISAKVLGHDQTRHSGSTAVRAAHLRTKAKSTGIIRRRGLS